MCTYIYGLYIFCVVYILLLLFIIFNSIQHSESVIYELCKIMCIQFCIEIFVQNLLKLVLFYVCLKLNGCVGDIIMSICLFMFVFYLQSASYFLFRYQMKFLISLKGRKYAWKFKRVHSNFPTNKINCSFYSFNSTNKLSYMKVL